MADCYCWAQFDLLLIFLILLRFLDLSVEGLSLPRASTLLDIGNKTVCVCVCACTCMCVCAITRLC